MIDDSAIRKRERMIFHEKLIYAEIKFKSIHPDNVGDEEYNNYFNEIIDIVNNHTIDYYKLDYSKIKVRNKSNKNITWEHVQSTDNDYDKFIFAKKVKDRCLVALENIGDINLLLNLGYLLGLITNIKNFYFTFDKEEAIQKSFDSRYKRFNTIFRYDIMSLAMDYMKFNDITIFSKKSLLSNYTGDAIRINQEQGFEFVEIGKLICNFKLKQAQDKVLEVGQRVKDVPWPK